MASSPYSSRAPWAWRPAWRRLLGKLKLQARVSRGNEGASLKSQKIAARDHVTGDRTGHRGTRAEKFIYCHVRKSRYVTDGTESSHPKAETGKSAERAGAFKEYSIL
jgi:hypothetical protein